MSDQPITTLVPQRFRYGHAEKGNGPTRFGCCLPVRVPRQVNRGWEWHIVAYGGAFGGFDSDPWEVMGTVLGDVKWFEWIDNDYGWHQ